MAQTSILWASILLSLRQISFNPSSLMKSAGELQSLCEIAVDPNKCIFACVYIILFCSHGLTWLPLSMDTLLYFSDR